MHFSYQHPQDIIVILKEVNQLHPRCPQCDMLVPREALNRAHTNPDICWRRIERKLWRLVVAEMEERMQSVLFEYGMPLTEVP